MSCSLAATRKSSAGGDAPTRAYHGGSIRQIIRSLGVTLRQADP
jgi:hypothetical protein